jgi:hypothetical protein
LWTVIVKPVVNDIREGMFFQAVIL